MRDALAAPAVRGVSASGEGTLLSQRPFPPFCGVRTECRLTRSIRSVAAAAADQNERQNDEPDPVVGKEIAKAVRHRRFLLEVLKVHTPSKFARRCPSGISV